MDYDRDQRPPVRENFSDEACRDFIIYELGLEKCLPQLYRYKEGVEEVRKRLMIRFGDTNLGRSMKIFNSILEDDDATGLGDEGDIWRSWRHSFVHCHDDLSNPGTPRFPNLVLPPDGRPVRGVTAMDNHYVATLAAQPSPPPKPPSAQQPSASISPELESYVNGWRDQASSKLSTPRNFQDIVDTTTRSKVVTEELLKHTPVLPSLDVTVDQASRRHVDAPPVSLAGSNSRTGNKKRSIFGRFKIGRFRKHKDSNAGDSGPSAQQNTGRVQDIIAAHPEPSQQSGGRVQDTIAVHPEHSQQSGRGVQDNIAGDSGPSTQQDTGRVQDTIAVHPAPSQQSGGRVQDTFAIHPEHSQQSRGRVQDTNDLYSELISPQSRRRPHFMILPSEHSQQSRGRVQDTNSLYPELNSHQSRRRPHFVILPSEQSQQSRGRVQDTIAIHPEHSQQSGGRVQDTNDLYSELISHQNRGRPQNMILPSRRPPQQGIPRLPDAIGIDIEPSLYQRRGRAQDAGIIHSDPYSLQSRNGMPEAFIFPSDSYSQLRRRRIHDRIMAVNYESSSQQDSERVQERPSLADRRHATLHHLNLDGAVDEPDVNQSRSSTKLPTMSDVKKFSRGKTKNKQATTINCKLPHVSALTVDGAIDQRTDGNLIYSSLSRSCVHEVLPNNTDGCYQTNPLNINHALYPRTVILPSPSSTHSPGEVFSVPHSARDCVKTKSTSSELSSSTHRSAASTKKNFRNITRDLLIPSTAERSPHLPATFDSLDPEKYSPVEPVASRTEMSEGSNRYRNIANMNPFRDDHTTGFADALEDERTVLVKTHHNAEENVAINTHNKGMPLFHSHSEGSFTSKVNQPTFNPSPFKSAPYKIAGSYTNLDEGRTYPPQTPRRGRAMSRTPSPIKHLQDVGEDEMLVFPPSPMKRAKSPMKKMFGENGWLGRSTSMKELSSEKHRKTGLKNWSGKIKQRVEEMTEDVTKKLPNPFYQQGSPPKSLSTSKFPVSLDPPTQAKLYAEVELMICVTANQYLMTQHREGRMSVESLVKVTSYWHAKNRPQVIEFQFDQSTQRDLVLYNLKSFRFYGPNAENLVSLNAMMLAWKSVAKEMSVRTFCTPDSVVRKHMHDCYKILEMMGAPLVTFLAFQEIQVKALATMRDEQKKRDEYESLQFGVERKWEPPARVATHASDDGDMDNPFEG